MSVDVVVGLQRGDEGKGRFVDVLAKEHDIVARFNGGNNAGHTVVLPDNRELALHLVPSGIAHEGIMNVLGNGTLINPLKLIEEINDIQSKGIEVSEKNLMISSSAHLILPSYVYADTIQEKGVSAQGSTQSGIAQVASQKAMRNGLRVEYVKNNPNELFDLVYKSLLDQRSFREEANVEEINELEITKKYIDAAQKIGKYVTDTVFYLNNRLGEEPAARILAEGAQAYWLDIDHGMYPFTTSSSTTSGAVCTGLGIAPRFIGKVTGVVKAVQSHVGMGPFVTEILDKKILSDLHGDMKKIDAEKGTTTGRIRRLGYLDLPQIKRSNMVNGTDSVALSKLDWIPRYGDEVKICTEYSRKGKKLSIAPDAAYKLEQSEPIYKTLPTWSEDIQNIKRFEDLPEKAKNFITFIEEQIKVHIDMIGVGPRRDQLIFRNR